MSLDKLIQHAREELRESIRRSRQSSYARRAPELSSLPYFASAHNLLSKVLECDPANREALIMLSQVHESVLDYRSASECLCKAFNAGEPRSKKLLKRLARLRQCQDEWESLPISPEMLRELGVHLETADVGPENRSLDLTREWLSQNGVDDIQAVLDEFARRGAFSDFQILANVIRG